MKSLLESAFAQRTRYQRQVRRSSEPERLEQVRADADDVEMLVTFEIAGQEFVLDLDVVQEVLPAPSITTPYPARKRLFSACTSLRGTLLPLLSLRALLGFPPVGAGNAREKVV